ncbi:hypothetical protein [Streptomyces demainii]|uniref:Uncharacterized protein n=1 Tax=Streptomyces demainii TaxID=588122 RepID=A0ABT9LAD2_9ACTN|nr:hypothetical protein [Streptomyces demainii]MDP9616491.1 hypothetical protein [Streptomyces demainii]
MQTPTADAHDAHGEAKGPVDGANPEWYPRVLRTLARDYPEISDKVWTTAVTENAVEKRAEEKQR